jgi:hypothetical protein
MLDDIPRECLARSRHMRTCRSSRGSGIERVQVFAETSLELIGVHSVRRLRGCGPRCLLRDDPNCSFEDLAAPANQTREPHSPTVT